MSQMRKLMAEVDRTLKKVSEGVELFDETWDKVYSAPSAPLKEKYEAELKKEIKKLQRHRDQIKSWISSSDIKDKTQLLSARRLIETKMEAFKECEREAKTKAFSNEGLAKQAKMDPTEIAKAKTRAWLSDFISQLQVQIEAFEVEIETARGKGKRGGDIDTMREYEEHITRHNMHIANMEKILRVLDNDAVDHETVDALKDDIEYYIESNQEPDFCPDDELYDALDLDAAAREILSTNTVRGNVRKSDTPKKKGKKKGKKGGKGQGSEKGSERGDDDDYDDDDDDDDDDEESGAAAPSTTPSSTAASTPTPAAAEVPAARRGSSGDASSRSPVHVSAARPQMEEAPSEAPASRPAPAGSRPPPAQPVPAQPTAAQALQQQQQQQQRQQQLQQQLQQQQQQQQQQEAAAQAAATQQQQAAQAAQAAGARGPAVAPPQEAAVAVAQQVRPGVVKPREGFSLFLAEPAEVLGAVDSGLGSVPRKEEQTRPRRYVPQRPHATHPTFPTEPAPLLATAALFQRLDVDSLFFAFYHQPGTLQQYLAAKQLKRQSWRFHKKYMAWFQRHEKPKITTDEYEEGAYIYFDYEKYWCKLIRNDFRFVYDFLEDELAA